MACITCLHFIPEVLKHSPTCQDRSLKRHSKNGQCGVYFYAIKNIYDIIKVLILDMEKYMRNLRLKIEYEGNNYYGWQIQPNKKTVQGDIIKAIKSITGEEVELIGSGRTDTGVCAYSQVANFKLNKEIELNKLKLGLNSKLKGSIVIKDIEEVSQEFHSRFNAKKKTYIYVINNNEVPSALTENKEYYYKRKLF